MTRYIIIFFALSIPIVACFVWLWWQGKRALAEGQKALPSESGTAWTWFALCSLVFVIIAFIGLGLIDEA